MLISWGFGESDIPEEWLSRPFAVMPQGNGGSVIRSPMGSLSLTCDPGVATRAIYTAIVQRNTPEPEPTPDPGDGNG